MGPVVLGLIIGVSVVTYLMVAIIFEGMEYEDKGEGGAIDYAPFIMGLFWPLWAALTCGLILVPMLSMIFTDAKSFRFGNVWEIFPYLFNLGRRISKRCREEFEEEDPDRDDFFGFKRLKRKLKERKEKIRMKYPKK